MKTKTAAAVMAAVDAYLQEEQAKAAVPSVRPALLISSWKLTGRQDQMRRRTSLQQRTRR